MLTVRRAGLDDARAIAAVHIRSWRAAYRGLLPDRALDQLSLEAREGDWRGWLSEGGAREFTLVAERDGTPVAFCTLEMPAREDDEADDVAAIPALYADPEAFGTGAGSALMAAALEAVGEDGYREAVLWVLEGNRRAEEFYGRHGWRRDGGRRRSRFPGIAYASDDERPFEVRYRLPLD